MSGASQAASQDAQAAQAERRRKRKERAASRTPEPKNIVSGAGQPLDLSVRRELEEQLGHDFSRVRLHTDRDAGTLTELLGADAVAVGQDIFFREGTFRPGTTDGQRLLAHELLHTVQNPDGLGALRAGRDLGAVSLPQQAMEREAESAAQQSVRDGERAPEVEPGQSTPGWLRYATVDADRNRMEQLDPATLVDRLANGVVRSLRGDPEDRSKRTRMQLARLPDELQNDVLERLETRLLSSEHELVLDLVDEIEMNDELEQNSLEAPAVETDPVEELRFEREAEQRTAEEQREQERKPAAAPGPEKDRSDADGAAGGTPRNGGTRENGTTPQGTNARPGGGQGQEAGSNTGSGSGSSPSGAQQSGQQQSEVPAAPPQQESSSDSAAGDSSGDKSAGGQQDAEKKSAGSEEAAEEQRGAPAASEEESAARNRPGAVDPLVAGRQLKQEDKRGQEKPTGSPTASGNDPQLPGAFSRLDGVRNQDLDGPEEQADEDPFGSGSQSEVEVGGGEKSAWDVKLQPEDFLPEQDLDVSAVPTADKLDPASSGSPTVPSFPAPPVTRADQVQAERDAEDAEDAEDAAAENETEEDATGSPAGTEPTAEPDEAGPARDDSLALEQAAEARQGPGVASKDPKSGADPKAGPVDAQMTVQEAPGKSEGGSETKEGETKERAAKEEKGTSAAGDASGGAQEKASQQAVGGKAAAQEPAAKGEQKKPEPAPTDKADKNEPKADSQASGGPSADISGGTSPQASGGTQSESPQNEPPQNKPPQSEPDPRTESPAPEAKESAPAPTRTSNAPAAAAPAPKAAPSPKADRAPQSRASKSAPAAQGSRGGGGAAGGGKKTAPGRSKKKEAAAPNLSAVSPEAGLGTASKLKPHRALEALGGVGTSVNRTVGDEHKSLAGAPPSMDRPAGSPQTLNGAPATSAPGQYSNDPAKKVDAPEKEDAKVEGANPPDGKVPGADIPEPSKMDLGLAAGAKAVSGIVNGIGHLAGRDDDIIDSDALVAKILDLPTKDDALKNAQVGTAPGVGMQGDADQRAGEQGANVDDKGRELHSAGRDDAGRPLGEDQIYPHASKEQLTAKVPGAKGQAGGAPGGGASTGRVPEDAASTVAEHERGPQFQAAFSDGQRSVAKEQEAKDNRFRESKQDHKQKVQNEVDTNTRTQTDEREKATSEVSDSRGKWRKEQDDELASLGTKKTEKHKKIRQDVKDREEKADKDTEKRKGEDEKKAQDKQENAEREARKEQEEKKNESGNWLSKAYEYIKQKFLDLRNTIVGFFKEARRIITELIKNFKNDVLGWINDARKFVVEAIKQFVTDLIEFGKALLKAIVEIANRIRKLIIQLRDAAIKFVTDLANKLKKIITDLLDEIAKMLSGILDLLKKMLQDVIKAVVDAVKAVLDFAAKLLSGLGEFMLIAVDFLSDPGGWLGGAKNSAVDGAKNHLFREVKSAVKEWFQSKIEEIIGVPKAILDKLLKGGFTMEKIVKETWDAVVPQLPFIIGEIVITKVVAKLIPGPGWVMAVIDAIRTAIGALGEILRAMGAVLDWLKAVRSGGAGILFAKAVAAGIVALLELAYEALLSGIGKYVAKVGRRLKGVAAKLGGGKGDKPGGGRGAASEGSDDRDGKPANKKDQEQAPKSPGLPGTRPTTTRPRPGTKPDLTKPGTKPNLTKPTTQGPGKPRDTDPSKPKTPGDDKKPTGNDKNGKAKSDKDNDKPDTRPTPAARPKPKPEPQPKPKSEPETKPKPKDDTPGKPKDEKDSTKPKDEDKGPQKPKDQDPNRPEKKDDKDGPDKPKPGKGSDRPTRTRDKNGKDGNRDSNRPRHDKDRDGRPKDKDPARQKQDKKDRQKKEETSTDSKDDRLDKIVARIRPIINAKLERGITQSDHQAMRERLRAHYRLTALSKSNDQNFDIVARLNPSQRATNGHTDSTDRIDYRRPPEDTQQALPPTKLPPFTNGREKAPSFKAHHIHEPLKRGTEAEGSNALPMGWEMVADERGPDGKPYSAGGKWVRMHLLPAPLGGDATTSNLVPARGDQNKEAAIAVEHPAARALGKEVRRSKWRGKLNNMIWYDVNISYYDDDKFPGFPSSIKVMWGGYTYTGSHWKRDPATVTWPRNFMPPPEEHDYAPHTANVNRDDVHALRRATGISMYFAERIIQMRKIKNFDHMTALARALRKDEHLYSGEKDETLTGGSHKNKPEAIKRLRRAARNKWLTF